MELKNSSRDSKYIQDLSQNQTNIKASFTTAKMMTIGVMLEYFDFVNLSFIICFYIFYPDNNAYFSQ